MSETPGSWMWWRSQVSPEQQREAKAEVAELTPVPRLGVLGKRRREEDEDTEQSVRIRTCDRCGGLGTVYEAPRRPSPEPDVPKAEPVAQVAPLGGMLSAWNWAWGTKSTKAGKSVRSSGRKASETPKAASGTREPLASRGKAARKQKASGVVKEKRKRGRPRKKPKESKEAKEAKEAKVALLAADLDIDPALLRDAMLFSEDEVLGNGEDDTDPTWTGMRSEKKRKRKSRKKKAAGTEQQEVVADAGAVVAGDGRDSRVTEVAGSAKKGRLPEPSELVARAVAKRKKTLAAEEEAAKKVEVVEKAERAADVLSGDDLFCVSADGGLLCRIGDCRAKLHRLDRGIAARYGNADYWKKAIRNHWWFNHRDASGSTPEERSPLVNTSALRSLAEAALDSRQARIAHYQSLIDQDPKEPLVPRPQLPPAPGAPEMTAVHEAVQCPVKGCGRIIIVGSKARKGFTMQAFSNHLRGHKMELEERRLYSANVPERFSVQRRYYPTKELVRVDDTVYEEPA